MAVPKRKTSKARKRKRRTHLKLQPPNVAKTQKVRGQASKSAKFFCTHCNQPKPPHAVCPNCGYYRGRALVEVKR